VLIHGTVPGVGASWETVRGCVECWRWAANSTRMYTRRRGLVEDGARWGEWEPVTTVGLYRERHAKHLEGVRAGTWRGQSVLSARRP
jgi:hypothetical protein